MLSNRKYIIEFLKSDICKAIYLTYMKNENTISLIKHRIIPRFTSHLLLDNKYCSKDNPDIDIEQYNKSKDNHTLFEDIEIIYSGTTYDSVIGLLINLCNQFEVKYPNEYEHHYNIRDFYTVENVCVLEQIISKINESKLPSQIQLSNKNTHLLKTLIRELNTK